MKKLIVLLCSVTVYYCASGQPFTTKQSVIETAIKNKKALDEKQYDFSKDAAGFGIELTPGISSDQIEAFKKTISVIIEGIPQQTYAFDLGKNENGPILLIDFKKTKIQTIKEGDAVLLRTAGSDPILLFRLVNNKQGVVVDPQGTTVTENAPPGIYPKYFDEIKDKLKVNLFEKYKLPADFCCDTCRNCEDTLLSLNNRIVYDAITGLTSYLPYNFNNATNRRKTMVVRNNHLIGLRAGDPLIYIVRNVNPYLYNVELTDTAFLVNNESNTLLDNLLFSKFDDPQGIGAQGAGLEKKEKTSDLDRYLQVKTALIHLRAEMAQLLENYRVMSRFAHNCIEKNKQLALQEINTFLNDIGKHPNQSFTSFVDIYLDPVTADSSLNKSVKALYGEFWKSKYVIAYRFTNIPELDQINFKLAIRRKENSPYPDLLKSNYPTQIGYIRNFFKIDVSTGLYYSDLIDNKFTTRKDSNTVVSPVLRGNRIVKEDIGMHEFGFAAFMHFYYKFGYFFNAGLNIGAGFNFGGTIRPRYFTGASFMLGNNNRLCINTGLVFGNITELSDQYPKEADGSYKWLPEGESNLNTRNKLKSGWFVSVSYNLPFLKRKKAAADIAPPAPAKSNTAASNTSTGAAESGTNQVNAQGSGLNSETNTMKKTKTVTQYRKN